MTIISSHDFIITNIDGLINSSLRRNDSHSVSLTTSYQQALNDFYNLIANWPSLLTSIDYKRHIYCAYLYQYIYAPTID